MDNESVRMMSQFRGDIDPNIKSIHPSPLSADHPLSSLQVEGKWPSELELETLLRYWQRVLRLQDWEINLRVCRVGELGPRRLGEIPHSQYYKQAVIKVLHPVDYENKEPDLEVYPGGYDMERTIVHELLHLHTTFLQLPTEGAIDDMHEIMINILSQALVKLRRNEFS